MKIEVTQEDIDKGVREDGHNCAIALACERAGLDYPEVAVIITTDDGLEFSMPPEAVRFMEDFDAKLPVKPFSFELDDSPEEPL